MYCSSCGTSVERSLSYCKRCGAKLGDGASNQKELFPDSLIWAIVSVFVAGMGVIIGLMSVMKKELYFNDGIIIALTLLSFMLLFTIEGVLIFQLIRRLGRPKTVRDTSPITEAAPTVLEASPARALAESPPSVTEHTTRSFEPTASARKAE